jgi:hypothetical protein
MQHCLRLKTAHRTQTRKSHSLSLGIPDSRFPAAVVVVIGDGDSAARGDGSSAAGLRVDRVAFPRSLVHNPVPTGWELLISGFDSPSVLAIQSQGALGAQGSEQ